MIVTGASHILSVSSGASCGMVVNTTPASLQSTSLRSSFREQLVNDCPADLPHSNSRRAISEGRRAIIVESEMLCLCVAGGWGSLQQGNYVLITGSTHVAQSKNGSSTAGLGGEGIKLFWQELLLQYLHEG